MAKIRQSRSANSELDRLRARLAEAEETLNAIRSGDVDAIAVDGPHGRQIFTLQSADQPYRVLAERMNEGAAMLTPQGTILFCNQRLADMVGVPAERLVGSSVIAMLREDERPGFPQLVQQALTNSVRTESCLLRNDASMLPVQLSLSPIPLDESGQGICLIAADLSDRKRAEETAQASENLYRTLLDSLPQMVFAKDRSSRYISCNQNFARLLGIRPEEFAGKTDYDFFDAALADKYRADDQRVMQSGTTEEIVEEYRRGGHTMIVQTLKAPFRDPEGNTVGVLGIFWDITVRRQAEQTLKEQAALLDLAQDAILLRNLDNRILFWSRGARDLYGWTAEEALGKIAQELLHTEFPESLDAIQTSIQQAREWEGELKHTSRDGKAIVVASRWSVLRDEQGNPLAVMEINRDITDRKRAEGALKTKSRYTRSLIEASLDPLVTISREGKITDVNAATEKVTGVARDRLVGSDFCDYFTEPEEARRGYQQVFDQGLVRDYPLAIRHASGQVTDVLYNASVFRNAQGEIDGVFAAARDVSDRKQAEEALYKASLYTRSLIEASLDPLVTISREGKITDVNEATEKVTGVARDHLIGSDFCDYFTEPEKARRGYEEVFERGSVRDYPLAIRHASGQVTDVLYNASVFRNQRGEIDGVFAAARDITGRKRAEEALRTASLYTRSLIEASLDPLVTISREGKITDVNEATEKVTGLARERLIGSDFCNYFTQPEKARKGYEQVFAEGSVCDYPLALRHASGRLTQVLYNATVFKNERGETEGVFAAARDITERKRAEDEVRKLNEELEARVAARTAELLTLNKELESFTYAVAHDLRAPLRHIHGFSDLLLHDGASTLSQDGQHWLQCVLSGTGRMEKLLEDLLNLSRLGRQTINRRTIPLKQLVQEVIDDLAPETANRMIEWKLGDLPLGDCDPALMRVVFVNLLSNSVKFTRPRTAAIIEIGHKMLNGEPVLFVSDNGAGFDMKYVGKLFGVFQRLHLEKDFEGTGIGLATVQRILLKHGGRIWAESELDKGATFYFTLGGPEALNEQHVAEEAAV